jgi:PKHD-type hydroxylase
MQLFKVLNDEQIKMFRETCDKLEWKDGKGSARGAAKDIKKNQQAYPSDKNFKPISDIITKTVFSSMIKNYAFAKEIVGLRANKYGPGETYGWHVDMSHMNGKRTDMSFTLFLSDPDTYVGGELMMKTMGSTVSVKPKAGEMVIYPTGILHQVTPIQSGVRLGIVGWIESFIPDDVARASLFNLSEVLAKVSLHLDKGEKLEKETQETLNQTYYQLIRRFSQ